jgi:hypothetical protein
MLADVEQDAVDLQEIDLIENIGLLVEALRVSGRDRRTNNPIPGKAFKYLTALATKTPRITLTLLRELELLEEAEYRQLCLQMIPDIYEVRERWFSSEDFYQLWTLAPELAALVSLGGLNDDGRLQEWFEFVGWPEPDVELDGFEVGAPDCRGSINAQLIELPEEQLRQNLAAVGWNLTKDQVAKLDAASARPMTYPYWHQAGFAERNPFPA